MIMNPQLELIINHIPQAIFWKDRQSAFLGCNELFAQDMGFAKPADLLGKTDFDLPCTYEQALAFRKDDKEVMDSGEAKLNILEPIIKAGGEQGWLRTHKVPLRDAQGNVFGLVGMYQDFTDYKNAKDYLLEIRNQLEQEILSRNKELSQTNETLKLEIEERRRIEEELHKHQHHLQELVDAQTETLTKTNQQLRQEIIERQQIAEQLQRAKNEAETANRAKSIFLATMSHELRTPLAAIIGYTEMLQELGSSQLNTNNLSLYLDRIDTASKHLLVLISDILDISKIESEQIQFHYENITADALIGTVLNHIAPTFTQNNNVFKCHNHSTYDLLWIDKTKVQQILLNLLNNATKFTHDGEITLTVANDTQPDWISFEIKDTGIGITPEKLDDLFKPFVQVDGSSTRQYGGTGLGLAICHRYTEMMGGKIEVQSQLNEGATFFVRLPITPANTPKGL